jgi:hypothetical protein
MKRCLLEVAILVVTSVLAAGCQSPVFREEPRPAPAPEATPTDYVSARSFAQTKDLLEQVHSVVEATVDNIHFEFDECWGPRTVVTLGGVRSLVGAEQPASLDLYTFGGPLPGGSYMQVSELPRYVIGGRYLLLLRNSDWRYSPVIGDHAYRIERIAGKDVLISTSGRAVTGLGDEGVDTNTAAITLPVGSRTKGLPASYLVRDLNALLQPSGDAGGCRGDSCKRATQDRRDPSGTDDEKRRLVMSQRFARPDVRSDVNADMLKGAIDSIMLAQQISRKAERLQLKLGGRYFARPRYGCWNTTPTVSERRNYVDALVK